jgi:hypothetical protein
MLRAFRWYRRLRGGRWVRRQAGRLRLARWVRPGAKERAHEDYTALGSVEDYQRFRR